ncbi:helix-turn-helix domain-containing protein [uncultured Roseibium sp.]|uniref:helix-turn-helix domain-containing protein n=1 Tax=uncultured Roseibium sp. TaxID=1936171 RepID=UPI00261ECE30|nr:helix-turn-helix domain-containing protein [uncultured Roseibium sp.]
MEYDIRILTDMRLHLSDMRANVQAAGQIEVQRFMKRYSPRTALVFATLFLIFIATVKSKAEDPGNTCATGFINELENTLSENQSDQLRSLNAEYYIDLSDSLKTGEIVQREFTKLPCATALQAPLPGQTLWLRFAVNNDHETRKHWLVTFAETIFDDVIIYEQTRDELVFIARDGRTVPQLERASRSMKPGLPLVVGPDERKVFYLRVAGTVEPTLKPVIITPNLFADWSTGMMILNALFLSYVLSITIFSLIIFRQIETRFYKYYSLYLVSQFLFSFLYDGWLHKILGITLPVSVMSPVMFFFTGVAAFANVQYCRILLEVDAGQKRLRVLFSVLSVTTIISTVLAVLDPWTLAVPLHVIYFFCPLVLLIVALHKIREGLPQAMPIALSLLFFTSGLVVAVYFFSFPLEIANATYAYELIIRYPISWGYYIAIIGETTFMLIAISVMVKTMQSQKHAAIMEANLLRSDVTVQAAALKDTGARIDALETILTEDPNNNLLAPAEKRFLEQATDCVQDHIKDENFGVKELAAALATSEKTLGRRIKKVNGLTSAAFIRSVRLKQARDLILMRQHNTIAEIAHASGFSSVSHFSKMYRQAFNESPGDALKNATADPQK